MEKAERIDRAHDNDEFFPLDCAEKIWESEGVEFGRLPRRKAR